MLINWDLPLLGILVTIIPSFGTVGFSILGSLLTGLRVLGGRPILHSPGHIARGRRDVGAGHGEVSLGKSVRLVNDDVVVLRG